MYYFTSERLLLVPFLNYMYKASGSFQINVDCKWSSTTDRLLGKHTAVDNELLLSLKMNRASFHLVLALKALVRYQ